MDCRRPLMPFTQRKRLTCSKNSHLKPKECCVCAVAALDQHLTVNVGIRLPTFVGVRLPTFVGIKFPTPVSLSTRVFAHHKLIHFSHKGSPYIDPPYPPLIPLLDLEGLSR